MPHHSALQRNAASQRPPGMRHVRTSSTDITVPAHGQLGSRENRVMSDNDEHRELVAAWKSLNGIMDGLRQRLRWGDTEYADVADMADRVRGLSIHLDSAVELADQFRYESALALLRTGLEQCLADWLVFLGRTMVQRGTGVDDDKWDEWQAARAAGADWTTNIREWKRTKKGDVRIVREGMFSEPDEDGNRRQVSIYYFLLEQYRPTLGPPSVPGEDWTISRDELPGMAGENQAFWRVYLTWSALLTNLQANELIDDVDAGRLAAHYRFLSGFAHPVTDQRRNVYGMTPCLAGRSTTTTAANSCCSTRSGSEALRCGTSFELSSSGPVRTWPTPTR
jgi:hypothetical protein